MVVHEFMKLGFQQTFLREIICKHLTIVKNYQSCTFSVKLITKESCYVLTKVEIYRILIWKKKKSSKCVCLLILTPSAIVENIAWKASRSKFTSHWKGISERKRGRCISQCGNCEDLLSQFYSKNSEKSTYFLLNYNIYKLFSRNFYL